MRYASSALAYHQVLRMQRSECAGAGKCTVQVRFKSSAKMDQYSPQGTARMVRIALGAPLLVRAAPHFSTMYYDYRITMLSKIETTCFQ